MNLKQRIKNCELRIEKMKTLHAPQVLIDKELEWLTYNLKLLQEKKSL